MECDNPRAEDPGPLSPFLYRREAAVDDGTDSENDEKRNLKKKGKKLEQVFGTTLPAEAIINNKSSSLLPTASPSEPSSPKRSSFSRGLPRLSISNQRPSISNQRPSNASSLSPFHFGFRSQMSSSRSINNSSGNNILTECVAVGESSDELSSQSPRKFSARGSFLSTVFSMNGHPSSAVVETRVVRLAKGVSEYLLSNDPAPNTTEEMNDGIEKYLKSQIESIDLIEDNLPPSPKARRMSFTSKRKSQVGQVSSNQVADAFKVTTRTDEEEPDPTPNLIGQVQAQELIGQEEIPFPKSITEEEDRDRIEKTTRFQEIEEDDTDSFDDIKERKRLNRKSLHKLKSMLGEEFNKKEEEPSAASPGRLRRKV
jgi:hypothetical protein